VRDADRIIGLLEAQKLRGAKLIINRVRANMMKNGDMLDIDEICQILAIDLIGVVPDDEHVIKAANSGEPTVMSATSRASIAYRNIARRIVGDAVPLMALDEKKGAFTKLKKLFGLG